MPYEIKLAAATIVERCLINMGYNEYSMVIVRGLLTQGLFPVVDMVGDIFRDMGLQPSGKDGTAQDNCLVGLILLMYAWYTIPETRDLDFFEYVKPRTYGDDMLAAVKKEVLPFYNNISYANFCKQHYHMGVTPASKNGELKEYLDVHSISFLKRNFVYRKDLNRWVAPISKESLVKTLSMYIPSNEVSESTQMLNMVTASMWELFFHVDRLEYDRMRKEWYEYFSDTTSVTLFNTFVKTYDQLFDKFYKSADELVDPLNESS